MESIYAEGSPCMGQGPECCFETTKWNKSQAQAFNGPASDIGTGDGLKVQTAIKRDAQGCIDYQFYHQRAARLRAENFLSVGKAIRRFLLQPKRP